MDKASQNAGFTLVETLIALSIFALIALGGVALLDITVSTQERLEDVTRETRSLQRMQAILRSDFGQMMWRQSRDENGALEFSAVPDSGAFLEFARLGRLEDPEDPRPKLEKIRYRLEAGVLYRAAFMHLDGAAPPRAIALIDQLESLKLRIFRDGRWTDLAAGMALEPMPEAFELEMRHQVHGPLTLRFVTPAALAPRRLQQAAF